MDNRNGVEKVLITTKEKLALEDHYIVFSVALLYFSPLHVPFVILFKDAHQNKMFVPVDNRV